MTSPGNQVNEDGELMPPEKLELWRQDSMECVKELMHNPMLRDSLKYVLEWHFLDKEGVNCIFNEM